MTITPGPVLIADRYEVGDLLGRGGMADVYEGIDHRLHRPVAIKRLRPDMAARADIRVRFESEARTAARLAHPNAVSVFDTGEHEGIPYIVMERLPGETLADRMAEGRVDPDWLRTVALEVLDALAAAHAAGIVHRDVKPGNILLGGDGRAMIADFGIAKSVTAGDIAGGMAPDPTQTGQWVGTPAYIAPERLNGGPATPQTDLYALGVVLYEALAGHKPFTGPTPLATANAIVNGDYPPLSEVRPDLDPGLVATVEQAMSTDPAQRFASAQDMATALAGSLVTAPSPTVAPSAANTQVFGDRGFVLAGGAPRPDAAPDSTGAMMRRRWRRVWIWAGIGALGLVMMLVLASTANNDPAPANSDAAATESPAMQLAGKLRAQAARLSPADGPAAAQAAQRLEEVAVAVERNEGGPAATGLLAQVGEWNRNGELSQPATDAIVGLLQQVPGVDMSALNPPPTVAPRSAGSSRTGRAPAAPKSDDKGKQKDEQKSDEGKDEKKAEEEAPAAADQQSGDSGNRASSESVTDGATSSDQDVSVVSPGGNSGDSTDTGD